MLILAVDTSTRAGSLALLDDGQVLAVVGDSQEIPYAERLFSDLASLQQRAKFALKDVDVFAVAAGPGSFTGLRVGLSAVKAWAEVYEKPIAAISGLEAIAVQSQANTPLVAACMDARRGAVFGAVYRRRQQSLDREEQLLNRGERSLELIGSEAILSLEEFCALIRDCRSALALSEPAVESLVIASPTPEAIASAGNGVEYASRGVFIEDGVRIPIEAVSPILAPAIGLLAAQRAGRGDLVSALQLDANYVRRSDAEAKKGS